MMQPSEIWKFSFSFFFIRTSDSKYFLFVENFNVASTSRCNRAVNSFRNKVIEGPAYLKKKIDLICVNHLCRSQKSKKTLFWVASVHKLQNEPRFYYWCQQKLLLGFAASAYVRNIESCVLLLWIAGNNRPACWSLLQNLIRHSQMSYWPVLRLSCNYPVNLINLFHSELSKSIALMS